jgi:hypothetical protein
LSGLSVCTGAAAERAAAYWHACQRALTVSEARRRVSHLPAWLVAGLDDAEAEADRLDPNWRQREARSEARRVSLDRGESIRIRDTADKRAGDRGVVKGDG